MPFAAFTDSTYNRSWPISMRPGPVTRCDGHFVGHGFTDAAHNRTWGQFGVPECLATSTAGVSHPYEPGSYSCDCCLYETLPLYTYVTLTGVTWNYPPDPDCDPPDLKNQCGEDTTNQAHVLPEYGECLWRKNLNCYVDDGDCQINVSWSVILNFQCVGVPGTRVVITCGGQFQGWTPFREAPNCLPWHDTVSNEVGTGEAEFWIPGP